MFKCIIGFNTPAKERVEKNLLNYNIEASSLLSEYLKKEKKNPKDIYHRCSELNQVVYDYMINEHGKSGRLEGRGRYMRPFLTYCGYKSIQPTLLAGQEEDIIHFSLITEFLFDACCIQDDVMDNANMRRGIPSFHIMVQNMYKHLGVKERFGEHLAILGSNLLYAHMFEFVIDSNFSLENKLKAVSLIMNTLRDTIYGQTMDMFLDKDIPNEESILKCAELKTAKFSFEFPLLLGATLGGANQEILNLFSKYGIPLGIALQLENDCLEIFDINRNDKSSQSRDIQEGKYTLLLLKAIENATPEQKEFIISKLGTEISEQDFQRFRDIMQETSALKSTQKIINAQLKEAGKALLNLKEYIDPGIYLVLEDLTKNLF